MKSSYQFGVIGGSGLYRFSGLQDIETIDMDTPFGKPSAPIIMGVLSGKRVAFLARHGLNHSISPSEVNYRANIFALKSIGVKQIISVSACGSLRDDYAPGHIVIPDQIIDFTRSRPRTFFGDGLVVHIGTAEPYCVALSSLLYQSVADSGAVVHKGGALITIEGPRFSTRGESNLFRSWGMDIIGMTASPEAFLAREAEICYSTMAHVTDFDVWHISEEPVSVEMVVRTLMKNTEIAQQSIRRLIETMPEEITCGCQTALADAFITRKDLIPPETIKKLGILVDKYFPA
jgi:5'-methylthioadenosine phosphorylase